MKDISTYIEVEYHDTETENDETICIEIKGESIPIENQTDIMAKRFAESILPDVLVYGARFISAEEYDEVYNDYLD
jgi:hypothetical protein